MNENLLHDLAPAKSITASSDLIWKIIIANDDEEVHRTTRDILADYTFEGRGLRILSTFSGAETLALMRRHADTAVILLDVAMESSDAGLRVIDRIRGELANSFVRIILQNGQPAKIAENRIVSTGLSAQELVTTLTASLRTYRDMQIIDQNQRGLEKTIEASLNQFERQSLHAFVQSVLTQGSIFQLNQQIIDAQKDIIFTLGAVIESHSSETGRHVRRVAELSHRLALKSGLSQSQADLLRLASPMHDVGKLGIPDAILYKREVLTPAEAAIIKNHTEIGYSILKNSRRAILEAGVIVARQHHERWDGRGYPLGLKGEGIHMFGRITAISDVFDALLHERAYKAAWCPDRVLDYLRQKRGSWFDPRLVDIMLENSAAFLALSTDYPEHPPA